MARVVSKSIAIIGEGETEWFYFDSLRVACRFSIQGGSGLSATQRHPARLEVGGIIYSQTV